MPTTTIFVDETQDKWIVSDDGSLCVQTEHGYTIVADAREFADFLQSELAKDDPAKDAPAKPDADGWIEWNGIGLLPLEWGTPVDVCFGDGQVSYDGLVEEYDWVKRGGDFDIVRYRPAKGGEA